MDYFVLILAILFWITLCINAVKKYSIKSTGVKLFVFYTCLAILAFHLYLNSSKTFCGQNLLAHIYLAIIIYYFSACLANLEKRPLVLIHPSPRIMNPIYIVVITFSLIGIPQVISSFAHGFLMLMIDDEYGAQLYSSMMTTDNMLGGDNGGVQYLNVLTNMSRTFAPFLFLYYLSVPKKNKFIFIGLLLSFLLLFMSLISLGSRSSLVSRGMFLLFMFLFMKRFYSPKLLKKIRPFLICFTAVVFSSILLITVSRALVDGSNPLKFVESYASQSILNFGKYGLDPGGCRYGDRIFPVFKSIFTSNVADTYAKRMDKYTSLNIDESSFYTFVGDFILDFGVIGGTVVLALIYLFFKNKLRTSRIGIQHLSIVYLLIMLLCGFYLYPLSDNAGNLTVIMFLIVYYIFKYTKSYAPNKIQTNKSII